MKKLGAIALVLGFGLAACGGGDVATATKLKDKMCACTDQKCMDDAEKDAKDFGKSLADKYKSKDDAPKDLMEAYEGYQKCRRDLRHKLEDTAAPTPPPASATP